MLLNHGGRGGEFKWQTILQHGGRMLRRAAGVLSRGWAGAAGWTHSAHEAGPKAVQEPNTEAGTNSSSQKKKKGKKKKKTARKLGAQCPSLCKPMWPCRWAAKKPFLAALQSHRLQEKEQENKKKYGTHQSNSTFKPSWGDSA